MKEIFQNDYFHIRTDEQQEIINLICDNFPSSGFPRQILVLDDIICISSYLGYMSIGYKHYDYEEGGYFLFPDKTDAEHRRTFFEKKNHIPENYNYNKIYNT